MHREGHVGAALLAYAPVGFVVVAAGSETLALVGGVAAAGLATLPDYDLRVPGVEHRGPTHTVWFALAVGTLGALLGAAAGTSNGPLSALLLAAFGFATGTIAIVSHVAADALTPAGVRPFAPLRADSYTYEVTRAANPVANYVLLGIGVVAAALALAAGTWVAGVIG
ncbi:metal-dependent hydrolase [Halobacteriales archaeon SW_7_68_16]|nr:MAG: metal-dependent hydrolase [Halobacteriales archaeon SW_7_68_16]